MGYKVSQQYITENRYWNAPEQKVNGIILHSSNFPFPKANTYVKEFNDYNFYSSIHGYIEPGNFIEMVPCFEKSGEAKRCYHIGIGPKGSYNYSRLGLSMTEPSTIRYLGNGDFIDKKESNTKSFLHDIIETAAEVCADLCIFHHIPVENIQTHHGAYLEGMGSNGPDPDHLWNYLNYSIEDFRKDVQKWIDKKS